MKAEKRIVLLWPFTYTKAKSAAKKGHCFRNNFLLQSQKLDPGGKCPGEHSDNKDATQILKEWNEGDKDAPARLMPLVYENYAAWARST